MGTTSWHARMPDMTIPSGQTSSNANQNFADCALIALFSTTSTPETYVIEVSLDNVTFNALQDATNTDIGPPMATKARAYIDIVPFSFFRITAGVAVAGDRTWNARGYWTT